MELLNILLSKIKKVTVNNNLNLFYKKFCILNIRLINNFMLIFYIYNRIYLLKDLNNLNIIILVVNYK